MPGMFTLDQDSLKENCEADGGWDIFIQPAAGLHVQVSSSFNQIILHKNLALNTHARLTDGSINSQVFWGQDAGNALSHLSSSVVPPNDSILYDHRAFSGLSPDGSIYAPNAFIVDAVKSFTHVSAQWQNFPSKWLGMWTMYSNACPADGSNISQEILLRCWKSIFTLTQ